MLDVGTFLQYYSKVHASYTLHNEFHKAIVTGSQSFHIHTHTTTPTILWSIKNKVLEKLPPQKTLTIYRQNKSWLLASK